MRCEFCGEDIEGHPFYKDGMGFCSLECADAMEGGETIPMGEDVLDDPDDMDDADQDYSDSDDDDEEYEDDDFGKSIFEDDEQTY